MIFDTNMQILSEVVKYEGMNIKKGSVWVVGGLYVPVCAKWTTSNRLGSKGNVGAFR